MNRFAPLVLSAMLAAAAAVLLPACEAPDEPPKRVFEVYLESVRSKDYDEWFTRYTEDALRSTFDEVRQQQAAARPGLADPQHAEAMEQQIRRQYGVDGRAFLAMTPQDVLRKQAETNRERILAWELSAPPEVTGDRGVLSIRDSSTGLALRWKIVKREGRWLYDGVLKD